MAQASDDRGETESGVSSLWPAIDSATYLPFLPRVLDLPEAGGTRAPAHPWPRLAPAHPWPCSAPPPPAPRCHAQLLHLHGHARHERASTTPLTAPRRAPPLLLGQEVVQHQRHAVHLLQVVPRCPLHHPVEMAAPAWASLAATCPRRWRWRHRPGWRRTHPCRPRRPHPSSARGVGQRCCDGAGRTHPLLAG
jgi:hypothetical protein